MKIILIGAAAALGLGGMVAAGSMSDGGGGEGEVYARPIGQVQAELAAMPMSPEVARAYRKSFGDRMEVRQESGAVVWRFSAQGREVARFTATLTEEGPERTRVSVDYTPGALLKGDDGDLLAHPVVAHAAELTMAEQIDSTFEGRSFDEARVKAAVTAYAAMHPDEVKSIELSPRKPKRSRLEPEPGGWGAAAAPYGDPDGAEATNAAADVGADGSSR